MNDPICNSSRRQMVRSLVSGSLLLPGIVAHLLADEARGGDETNPLAAKAPHFPAKAKRVIFLYMSGGVSHMDSFDPKPRLLADAENGVPAPGGRPYMKPL